MCRRSSRPPIRRKRAPIGDQRSGEPAPDLAPTAPVNDDRKSAIVTIKRKSGRFGDVPDMTPEEHKRRGDAADALFREMKRQIAEKLRKE